MFDTIEDSAHEEQVQFSFEEEELFDKRYNLWIKINHPEDIQTMPHTIGMYYKLIC